MKARLSFYTLSLFYMRNISKKWFTLVELIIVITILAILGTVGYLSYSSYIDDAGFSNDNTLFNQARTEVERKFIKDFAYDGSTNSDHRIRFDRNLGGFSAWTIDSSDSSALTYTEASQVFFDNLSSDLSLTSSEFNVLVCDRDATNTAIDAVLNTRTTTRAFELIVFTDETATGTDCTGTITWGSTQIAGMTFRYKNAKFDGTTDYDSALKLDGGASCLRKCNVKLYSFQWRNSPSYKQRYLILYWIRGV